MSGRDEVLRRIALALGRDTPSGAPSSEAPSSGAPSSGPSPSPGPPAPATPSASPPAAPPTGGAAEPAYRRAGVLTRVQRVELFAERAGAYRVDLRRVDEASLPAAVADALSALGAVRVAAPPDLPASWRVDGFEWRIDATPADAAAGERAPLSVAELDACDAVVTGCALALAETGTIVFDGGARQGRRALTLLPDVHVCVVREDQVVETVAEAVAGTAPAVLAGAPLTLVSGPSATSDIELERVEGVHGPRTLVVLLVG